MTKTDATESDKKLSLRQFLETVPPCIKKEIVGFEVRSTKRAYGNLDYTFRLPEIELICENCAGRRHFRAPDDEVSTRDPAQEVVKSWEYWCRNCGLCQKVYSVLFECDVGRFVKLGEWPPFGPHVPANVIKLIGPDRDLFLQGRRAESLGLGIGAYTYYRRVVEGQKDRIIDRVVQVARQVKLEEETIRTLAAAKGMTSFERAVEAIGHAFPDRLRIETHNPLRLLHGFLSKGVHEMTDDECLERATAARHVLAEFADLLKQALRDRRLLLDSVAKLQPRPTTPADSEDA